jgi:HAD superfamily hydrolase (TIGR01490 family)
MNENDLKIAIFDLDNTILKADSDYEMVNFLISKNLIEKKYRKLNDDYFASYGSGTLDIEEFSEFSLKPFIGMTRSEIEIIVADFYQKVLAEKFNPYILSILDDHKNQGDLVILASATNSLIVSHVAKMIGLDEFVSSVVSFSSGVCTGTIKQPHALGEGKLVLVTKFLLDRKLSFDKTYFYSDSINDEPLMRKVKYPVAVNPDAQLLELSKSLGWDVLIN